MVFQQLWSGLPETVRLSFEQNAEILEYPRGKSVYQPGDNSKGIYFVQTGLVGLVLLGRKSGREHLLRFFKPGQFFGHRSLLSQEPHHGRALVLSPARLKFISRGLIFQEVQKHPVLLWDMARQLSRELRICEESHVSILEEEVLARVARALIYLKELHPEHSWTRQEIANFCASTASTVIKTMAEIEKRNLIRQSGRAFEIIDPEALLELSVSDVT